MACHRGELIEKKAYVLDPHSAIGIAASLREIGEGGKEEQVVSLATAHPAKFTTAVDVALKDEDGLTFDDVLPEQFVGLDKKERRVLKVARSEGLDGIRNIIIREVDKEEENVRSRT